jgi:hypothetical protein
MYSGEDFYTIILLLLCMQSDIMIIPGHEEFVELNAGKTLCGKAEAEGFEPSVEVLAPTTV